MTKHDWEEKPERGMTVLRCKRCRCYEPQVYASRERQEQILRGCEDD